MTEVEKNIQDQRKPAYLKSRKTNSIGSGAELVVVPLRVPSVVVHAAAAAKNGRNRQILSVPDTPYCEEEERKTQLPKLNLASFGALAK